MAADIQALPEDATVSVVGAGAMGSGIAQVAALAGHKVLIYDTRAGTAAAAVGSIAAQLDRLVAKGRLSAEKASQTNSRLKAVDTLDALAESALVIEAIVEQIEAKRGLFRSLERLAGDDAILATNTSSIPITAIGVGLRNPERLAGLHFFNPAPLMALVEVVSGAHTAPEVAARLHATAKRWGKVPVHARSTPGFIVNRVARPFYAEGLRLLDEGAADCATIDAVLREAGGFRMGPFELMDLIGHDVNYAVTRTVFESFYGDSRFTPSLRQLDLVEAGFLGRKTGRGFYRYGEGAPQPMPSTAPQQFLPSLAATYGERFGKVLAHRLEQFGCPYLPAHSDDRIADGTDFVLYRSDGRTATERAARSGLGNVVVVDYALDDDQATRLAIAAADQSDPKAIAAAAGLLQTAGYAVSIVDDVPGLIVARTVAMLANEAADAVYHGVCTAADVDLAMRNGVNYPRGPLEWAESLGISNVVAILDNLAQAYGEDRYRASPLLRRKSLSARGFSQKERPA